MWQLRTGLKVSVHAKKLGARGVPSLSDMELSAIFLRTGLAEPCQADQLLTVALKHAPALDVPVLDHFVMAVGRTLSCEKKDYCKVRVTPIKYAIRPEGSNGDFPEEHTVKYLTANSMDEEPHGRLAYIRLASSVALPI
jgi:hypothetical protein